MGKSELTFENEEVGILCESYSKEELAEIILLSLEFIQEKNKLLEQKYGQKI